jgi:hypothetical protein
MPSSLAGLAATALSLAELHWHVSAANVSASSSTRGGLAKSHEIVAYTVQAEL